jgi:ferredoxin
MEHMEIKNVAALYFSPTYTTRKVVETIAVKIDAHLRQNGCSGIQYRQINVTTPIMRKETPSFSRGDVVVFGVPVYIGRVPNLIREFFASIKGNGAIGIPVVVYGNRAFDDALIELYDIMQGNGFRCISAAAFIGEHSFSYTLGGGRPDASDISIATSYGEEIAGKILAGYQIPQAIAVPGNPYPYKFYNAKSTQNKSIDIRKVKPETDPEKCNNCGLCAMLCPMGAIDPANCSLTPGICIKCCACIKKCKTKAKYFTDPTYLEHKEILEKNFTVPRKEPEIFW